MPAPMLAASSDLSRLTEFCTDDRYQLEQKIDGARLCVQLLDGEVLGFNRRGERKAVPNQLAKILQRCPINVVLDGELIGPTWFCFDMPEAYTVVTPETPLRVRRAALETLVQQCNLECHHLRLLPATTTTEAKTLLAKRVIEAQAEGLMAKDLEGAYLYGKRGSGMLKIKLIKQVDAVVIGFSAHGHDSLSLGVYDGDKLVPIGEVTRQAGDGGRLVVGDVCAVSYLYWTGTRLVQPTRPMWRDPAEKAPTDCTIDQLVVANTKEIIPI